VTVEDIEQGRVPRPKVLDMFAGGGAIPLEALRLGCEAHALELNPVAHIIELCTLVFPQKYGKPDPTARGETGPTSAKKEATWGGLAKEVRYWGEWVLKKVKAEIGDLYPLIPDPAYKKKREPVKDIFGTEEDVPAGYLMPVAYLWTRTVTCKNPTCKATVPLAKQTWLCKKKGRFVALRVVAPKGGKEVRFKVVEASTEKELGFDPDSGSKGGNVACPFCGTVNESDHVKVQGNLGAVGQQMMAAVGLRRGVKGKIYLAADDVLSQVPDDAKVTARTATLCSSTGLSVPAEPTPDHIIGGGGNCQPYGFKSFGQLYSPRQMLSLLTFAAAVRQAEGEMAKVGYETNGRNAIMTYLGAMVDKLADFNSGQCTWNYTGGRGVGHTFTKQALPMTWDFAETCPFNQEGASWPAIADDIPAAIEMLDTEKSISPIVQRGSAVSCPWPDASLDAVVTDPPYYDNIGYAILSDYFYVWLKRTIGHLYPEHFATESTPKKPEAVADSARYGGSKKTASAAYESMMAQAFAEANRMLKPGGPLVVVYAHKTTLGWATLVDALRKARFVVSEAWPLDTEMKARTMAMESAALATSIFLVARKRERIAKGSYEEVVHPELEAIVRERVDTLWDMGISGADLVIACVGAGLRAFTRFARVEYGNGDEVPAERFLLEVETVVLDSIFARLSKEVGGKGTSLAGVDPATRFYTLWRYTYRAADLDAGEAIIFANGTHVELDGASGMSSGADALVEKKKGKYRLRDFTERGDDDDLGKPTDEGQAAPLVDVLHRVLWLMEHRPRELAAFLRETEPNREQLRLVAQALGGPALKGGEMADVSPTAELAALAKLTSNWRSVIEDNATTAAERADVKRGQNKLFE
jgi:putative DNA methylase